MEFGPKCSGNADVIDRTVCLVSNSSNFCSFFSLLYDTTKTCAAGVQMWSVFFSGVAGASARQISATSSHSSVAAETATRGQCLHSDVIFFRGL